MIIPLFQPPDSSFCGQVCVAMVAGISIEESIRIFGHKHATNTREVNKALNSLGISTLSQRLKRLATCKKWPQRAIIKEIYGPIGKRKSHWVLLWDGKIYDPSPHEPNLGKYSSYLEIL